MEGFNLVDIAAAVIVLLSAFFAFYRGFAREALAIAGWVGAAVVAYYFFGDARPWLAPYIENESLLAVATGGTLFVGSLIFFGLVVHYVAARIKKSPLSALDRSLGFLFGVARGIVVVALLFLLSKYTSWDEQEGTAPDWLANAASYTLIEYTADMVERTIPEDLLDLPPVAPSDMLQEDEWLDDATPLPEQLAQPPVVDDGMGGEPVYEEDPARLLDLDNDIDDPGAGKP